MTTPMIIEPEVIDGECVRVNEWETEKDEYEFISHVYDYTPGFAEILKKIGSNRVWGSDEIYRNVDYVKDECIELARQLKEIEYKALVAPDSK